MHLSDDNQQMIRVIVAVENEQPSVQQAQSGVVAKIYTGHDTSIGFLWLHDIQQAYHRYVAFYFAR